MQESEYAQVHTCEASVKEAPLTSTAIYATATVFVNTDDKSMQESSQANPAPSGLGEGGPIDQHCTAAVAAVENKMQESEYAQALVKNTPLTSTATYDSVYQQRLSQHAGK
jgi:hypothetical protein